MIAYCPDGGATDISDYTTTDTCTAASTTASDTSGEDVFYDFYCMDEPALCQCEPDEIVLTSNPRNGWARLVLTERPQCAFGFDGWRRKAPLSLSGWVARVGRKKKGK